MYSHRLSLIIRFTLVVMFAIHVLATALFLLPLNPILDQISPLLALRTYTRTYFNQNWHFFAPEPGIYSNKIWLNCQATDGETMWLDPSVGLIEEIQRFPLSPSGKESYLHRELANTIRSTLVDLSKAHCEKAEGKLVTLCPKGVDAFKLTAVYRRSIKYGKDQCIRRGLSSERLKTVKMISVSKQPFPYSMRSMVGEKPYYQLYPIRLPDADFSYELQATLAASQEREDA